MFSALLSVASAYFFAPASASALASMAATTLSVSRTKKFSYSLNFRIRPATRLTSSPYSRWNFSLSFWFLLTSNHLSCSFVYSEIWLSAFCETASDHSFSDCLTRSLSVRFWSIAPLLFLTTFDCLSMLSVSSLVASVASFVAAVYPTMRPMTVRIDVASNT